jgi:hypothetical protein
MSLIKMKIYQPNPSRFQQQQQPDPSSKKPAWGKPTWFLFHTLAEKINEADFPYIRQDLLNMIFKICNHLPCPDCANHATQYMQGINFNVIQTKEQLQTMLWSFHNTVNKKKGYPPFPRDQLSATYQNANTKNIIENFMFHFDNSVKGMPLKPTAFQRNMQSELIKKWLVDNIRYFQP